MKRLIYGLAVLSLLVGLTGPVQAQYGFTTIDVPGATYSLALGINNAGQIVGQYQDAGYFLHGFLLDVDGSYTTLDPPGAMAPSANGINDVGQIVGEYTDGGGIHGFLRDVDGNYTSLDPPGATLTFANGINDAGQIVGWYLDAGSRAHGFLATPK
jgi:probable HAF family extracellular repeat protein